MEFIRHDLGYVSQGTLVEVNLSAAANVRLMDSANFNNYQAGRRHEFYGGLSQQTPIHLTVPHDGTWYVAVDMQGLRGSVRSSVRTIS
jgi:hypothetical protein